MSNYIGNNTNIYIKEIPYNIESKMELKGDDREKNMFDNIGNKKNRSISIKVIPKSADGSKSNSFYDNIKKLQIHSSNNNKSLVKDLTFRNPRNKKLQESQQYNRSFIPNCRCHSSILGKNSNSPNKNDNSSSQFHENNKIRRTNKKLPESQQYNRSFIPNCRCHSPNLGKNYISPNKKDNSSSHFHENNKIITDNYKLGANKTNMSKFILEKRNKLIAESTDDTKSLSKTTNITINKGSFTLDNNQKIEENSSKNTIKIMKNIPRIDSTHVYKRKIILKDNVPNSISIDKKIEPMLIRMEGFENAKKRRLENIKQKKAEEIFSQFQNGPIINENSKRIIKKDFFNRLDEYEHNKESKKKILQNQNEESIKQLLSPDIQKKGRKYQFSQEEFDRKQLLLENERQFKIQYLKNNLLLPKEKENNLFPLETFNKNLPKMENEEFKIESLKKNLSENKNIAYKQILQDPLIKNQPKNVKEDLKIESLKNNLRTYKKRQYKQISQEPPNRKHSKFEFDRQMKTYYVREINKKLDYYNDSPDLSSKKEFILENNQKTKLQFKREYKGIDKIKEKNQFSLEKKEIFIIQNEGHNKIKNTKEETIIREDNRFSPDYNLKKIFIIENERQDKIKNIQETRRIIEKKENNLYAWRQYKWEEQRQMKIEYLREREKLIEKMDCTFQPQLNPNSLWILKNKENYDLEPTYMNEMKKKKMISKDDFYISNQKKNKKFYVEYLSIDSEKDDEGKIEIDIKSGFYRNKNKFKNNYSSNTQTSSEEILIEKLFKSRLNYLKKLSQE